MALQGNGDHTLRRADSESSENLRSASSAPAGLAATKRSIARRKRLLDSLLELAVVALGLSGMAHLGSGTLLLMRKRQGRAGSASSPRNTEIRCSAGLGRTQATGPRMMVGCAAAESVSRRHPGVRDMRDLRSRPIAAKPSSTR